MCGRCYIFCLRVFPGSPRFWVFSSPCSLSRYCFGDLQQCTGIRKEILGIGCRFSFSQSLITEFGIAVLRGHFLLMEVGVAFSPDQYY